MSLPIIHSYNFTYHFYIVEVQMLTNNLAFYHIDYELGKLHFLTSVRCTI